MTRPTPLRLVGITGSVGTCVARAYVFRRRLEIERRPIEETAVARELERLAEAIELTRRDILAVQQEALSKHGQKYAAIFDSHLLMLSDPSFRPEVEKQVQKRRLNIEVIVQDVVNSFLQRFLAIEDEYLRERAVDMQDVGDRILRHLLGLEGPAAEIGAEPFVLLASDVTPTELLEFAKGHLRGICLDSGGATSHVAILAGALGIPSVFGLTDLSRVAHTGDQILVDTRSQGLVVLHPAAEQVATIAPVAEAPQMPAEGLVTADGYRFTVGANVARVEELAMLERQNIRRIGLFRSEFLFMESVDLPSETFQEQIYRQVVETARDMAVLRTIDIGSDKPVKYLPFPREVNPAMGFRSIRFALQRPDVLLPQVKAMIRASTAGRARIIFPMVSAPEELQAIKEVWERALDQIGPVAAPEWGIMVEVPSALFMMDEIARYTKYISLGTNDLLQFVYGMDRTNERLNTLAHPLCLPFLRLLLYSVAAAKGEGITVGICGEMAGDPAGFVMLAGLGIDEFSMRPAALPTIWKMIPQLNRRDVVAWSYDLLARGARADVRLEMARAFPRLASIVCPD
ncbi:MAG TPA: phosphoenolpyruvate--protein phosphotransferase [Candidatus Ozemobacteraceae bacterium]|nr:phosphoenolpyruvate--protein phosphotransferase [Candidatus Ozemobacteraceae bacterium]